MDFGPGTHSIGLQWKKSTGGIVTTWSNRPSSHDGFASGRSIVVTAQVSQVRYFYDTVFIRTEKRLDCLPSTRLLLW